MNKGEAETPPAMEQSPNETGEQYDGEVLIVVDGGVVQSVYSGAEINLRIRILDLDNLREIYDRDHRERIEKEACGDLVENITEDVQ